MKTRLYVDNLPPTLSQSTLTELFAQKGTVISVEIVMDRGGKPEGHAFVVMGTEEEAKTAIRDLNGHKIDKRALTVTQGEVPRQAGFSGTTTAGERRNR